MATKYIQRNPPIMKDDLRETTQEIIDYLEYLKANLNFVFDVYNKRMPQIVPQVDGNQATTLPRVTSPNEASDG